MKKNIMLVFAVLLFFALALVFIDSVVECGDLALIVPAILFLSFAIIFLVLLLYSLLVGFAECRIENNCLQISRKRQLVNLISSSEIDNLIFIKDKYSDDIECAVVSYRKRKFFVFCNEKNKESFDMFFDGISAKIKDNYIHYLISFVLNILSGV